MGPPLQNRLDFARAAAREAGAITLHHFRALASADIEVKADLTPVTIADRAVERLWRARISEAFPTDGIAGEEYGETHGTSGYRWHLDPIDGTKSFMRGVPLYGNLIGVEFDGRSVAGVINMPALRECVYAARGLGAWHVWDDGEPQPARVSAVASLSDALVCYTAQEIFHREGVTANWERVRSHAALTRGWSDCYGYLLVATGRAEATVEPLVAPWDVAPMPVILEEAGGTCTDWEGKPSFTARRSVATNGKVIDELLARLA